MVLDRRTSRIMRLLISWVLVMGSGIFFGGCGDDPAGETSPISGPSLVDRIRTTEEFKSLLDSGEYPVLVVEFYADWCRPCREVAPMLESIAKEAPPGIKIVKVDIDENKPLADRYRVRGIPSVVVLRGQSVVGSLLGVKPKRKYLEMIRKASKE